MGSNVLKLTVPVLLKTDFVNFDPLTINFNRVIFCIALATINVPDLRALKYWNRNVAHTLFSKQVFVKNVFRPKRALNHHYIIMSRAYVVGHEILHILSIGTMRFKWLEGGQKWL